MQVMRYTNEMRQFIYENCRGISSMELAEKVNEKFQVSVTKEQMQAYKKNHKLSSGYDCRFKKGQEAHNKGIKVSEEVYQTLKKGMFKKGHIPKNHRPVGSERIDVDGYIEIKVAEPTEWRLKHNVIWEAAHGEIPGGYAVIFLDKNKLNVDISNLMLIHKKELLKMNQYGLFSEDAELTKVGINIARIIGATAEAKRRSKKRSEEDESKNRNRIRNQLNIRVEQ